MILREGPKQQLGVRLPVRDGSAPTHFAPLKCGLSVICDAGEEYHVREGPCKRRRIELWAIGHANNDCDGRRDGRTDGPTVRRQFYTAPREKEGEGREARMRCQTFTDRRRRRRRRRRPSSSEEEGKEMWEREERSGKRAAKTHQEGRERGMQTAGKK